MRFFRTKVWTVADIACLKWASILFGMIAGALLSRQRERNVWVQNKGVSPIDYASHTHTRRIQMHIGAGVSERKVTAGSERHRSAIPFCPNSLASSAAVSA